jgi:hypothetical protein
MPRQVAHTFPPPLNVPSTVARSPVRSTTCAEQTRFFEMDKRQSHEVTLEELRGSHLANPFDHVAGLLSPQL